jgi:isopentenyldiphosphate isomerase
METEKLTIFDENRRYLGVKMRQEVHAQGYWHETFHCWFFKHDADAIYLLFQRRATHKKDFPGMLDITAAGHLLAGEKVAEGIREIQEELGIAPSYSDLQPIGIIKEQIILNHFIDREFCHTYLYHCTTSIENFILQPKEVDGIIQVELNDFSQLIHEERDIVRATGYIVAANGSKSPIDTNYKRNDICPHSTQYFLKLIGALTSFQK